jgi:hypothetical protein
MASTTPPVLPNVQVVPDGIGEFVAKQRAGWATSRLGTDAEPQLYVTAGGSMARAGGARVSAHSRRYSQ